MNHPCLPTSTACSTIAAVRKIQPKTYICCTNATKHSKSKHANDVRLASPAIKETCIFSSFAHFPICTAPGFKQDHCNGSIEQTSERSFVSVELQENHVSSTAIRDSTNTNTRRLRLVCNTHMSEYCSNARESGPVLPMVPFQALSVNLHGDCDTSQDKRRLQNIKTKCESERWTTRNNQGHELNSHASSIHARVRISDGNFNCTYSNVGHFVLHHKDTILQIKIRRQAFAQLHLETFGVLTGTTISKSSCRRQWTRWPTLQQIWG